MESSAFDQDWETSFGAEVPGTSATSNPDALHFLDATDVSGAGASSSLPSTLASTSYQGPLQYPDATPTQFHLSEDVDGVGASSGLPATIASNPVPFQNLNASELGGISPWPSPVSSNGDGLDESMTFSLPPLPEFPTGSEHDLSFELDDSLPPSCSVDDTPMTSPDIKTQESLPLSASSSSPRQGTKRKTYVIEKKKGAKGRGRPRKEIDLKKKGKFVHPSGRPRDQKVNRIPERLIDPEVMGRMVMTDQTIIKEALGKVTQVASGAFLLGTAVVIKSFQPVMPTLDVSTTFDSLLVLHTLFSNRVLVTEQGFNSLYPLTVFKSNADKKSGKGGFPVVALHRAHFKTLIKISYSAVHEIIHMETFDKIFDGKVCGWDPTDDSQLITVSGLEAYNHTYQKQEDSFILLPFHWLDAIKSFFVDRFDFCIKNLMSLCRDAYSDQPLLAEKFQDKFRCVILGEEHDVKVYRMIGDKKSHHSDGMTRNRALDGLIRYSSNGPLWSLPLGTLKSDLAVYNDNSLGYGVQCHEDQLRLFNSLYTLFTGQKVPKPCHMSSVFFLVPSVPVLGRDKTIRRGLLNDKEVKRRVSTEARNARYRLTKEFGKEIQYTFWDGLEDPVPVPRHVKAVSSNVRSVVVSCPIVYVGKRTAPVSGPIIICARPQ